MRLGNRRMKPSVAVQGELFLTCPYCQREVKVGGPINGRYTLQPHGRSEKLVGNQLCPGTNEPIKAP